jgi:hypothetical protein
MLLLDQFDFVLSALVILPGAVVLTSLTVIGAAKAKLIAEHADAVQLVTRSIGEIDCLEHAQQHAAQIRELLLQHDISSLMMPMRRGGRVSFVVETSGLLISAA